MVKTTSSPDSVKFDPALLNRWFAKYIREIRIVILLISTILFVGISALLTLPKRLNPEVKLTIVSVVTILPGAGPADTESLLTNPLENKLLGVKGLDTITSSSRDNLSAITMQFVSGVDKDKARNDVQAAVNAVTTLPADAQTPAVTAYDFEGTPIWNFVLTSIGNDPPTLMRFADYLKKRIEDIQNVDSVSMDGFDTQAIQVKVNPEKMANLGINPLQLSASLKTATVAYPAGLVNANGSNFSLSIDNGVNSVEDIRNLTFNIQDKPIRLGNIAEVYYKSKPGLTNTYLATPSHPARLGVTFFVYKSSGADIGTTVRSVENLVNSEIQKREGEFQVTTVTNTGEDINKQFTDVLGEFRSTLILVFINLLLFLGIRQALIASITIPLTFLMAFGWMSFLGQTINYISLFALLLAFGTSIDDTIVTVSAMTHYYKSGKLTAFETGILVWRDFVVPIWTTTITTVWAFLPLVLTTGIIGEFIKPIPVTVATTMYSSTAVAWFITLPLMVVLLRPQLPGRVKNFIKLLVLISGLLVVLFLSPKNLFIVPIFAVLLVFIFITYRIRLVLARSLSTRLKSYGHIQTLKSFFQRLISRGFIDTTALGEKYRRLITRIVSSGYGRKTVFIGLVIYAVVAYFLVGSGLVKNEFFPKTNGNNLYVNVDLPVGTDADTVDREARSLLNDLRSAPEIKSIIAEPGKQAAANGSGSDNSNSILFSLILTPKEQRHRSSMQIAADLRKQFSAYNRGTLSVIEGTSGPPAGADVQIKLVGDDLDILDGYSNQSIAYLKHRPGIINVDKSVKSGTGKLVFIPDKSKLAQAGISVDSIGFWLRLAVSGFTLDTVRLDGVDNDVIFYTDGNKLNPADLGRILIPSSAGNVPLLSLGTIVLKNNPTTIIHEEGKRTVSVTAGIVAGYSVTEANQQLIQYVDKNLNLTSGYTWKTGGVNEENTKSVQSIFKAMILSFIFIFATMVIEFRSFRQAAMILSLIPFAVSGVFYIFGLTGTPLSFPALIGIMALFGVVVTNAMFIVEKINQNRKSGMLINSAIADAGASRLEPIILTSLTSILGLVPITFANPLWRGLGGAIISGLLFSGLIMLFYIPVTYKTIYSKDS